MAEQKNYWQFDPEEFDLGVQGPKISDEEITIFRDIAFKIRHPDNKREVPWPSDCKPQREVFGSDLAYQYVYEWEKGNLWNRAYEIQVNAFIGLQYIVSFEGTENCDIQSAFKMNEANKTLTIELQPFEQECIFMITCNKEEDNKYDIKGSWKKCKIDARLYREVITITNNKITEEYNKCLSAGLNENVSWDKQPDIIRNNGLLFVDGEFYPGNEALYFKGDADERAIGDKNSTNYIQWRRAGDFLSGPFPLIFKDPNNLTSSIRPECIRMGDADNAWLISVLSVCALKPSIISNLFLSKDGSTDPSTNNEDKMYGFYRMKLCLNGIWKECILDDLFPCQPYWLPVMANTPNNDQLWPHLCEKLVAKMTGNCYQSLDGGSPSAAFADITGCPTETYDLTEQDPHLIFDKIHESYKQNNYNLLAVAICNEMNEIENVEEDIGLLSTHTYSVLGTDDNGQKKIKLRDPFGRNQDKFKGEYADKEKNNDGIIWVSFNEFFNYFTSVIVCYSDDKYKEARQTIDISYDRNKKEVSVPIIKLTVPNGGNVEYLGLCQKDLNMNAEQKNTNRSQLDLCLFVFKAKHQNGTSLNVEEDEPYGYIPMSTQRNKFVKFGASADDVKTNDLSSGMSWKNGDRLTDGSYYLVPWTSGIQWESEQKQQSGSGDSDVRYIGLTVHGQCGGGGGDFTLQPVDGYSGKDIHSVLMRFAFEYGEKKQWQDLERRHFQMGQLDIYCGNNTCNDKNLLFTMTPSEATNVTNAAGFEEFRINKEIKYKIEVGQSQLFAVNVPKDATREFSSVYKYGLQNEWL